MLLLEKKNGMKTNTFDNHKLTTIAITKQKKKNNNYTQSALRTQKNVAHRTK